MEFDALQDLEELSKPSLPFFDWKYSLFLVNFVKEMEIILSMGFQKERRS